jgi:hypothetical protein
MFENADKWNENVINADKNMVDTLQTDSTK